MKHVVAVAVVAAAGLIGCEQFKKAASANVKLDTDDQKVAYAIGQQIGNGMKSQGLKIDTAILAASIDDVLQNKPARLTQEQMQAAMMKMRENMASKQESEGKENLEKGSKFLEENKKKPNVKVTKSGLQYEVVAEGKGDSPKPEDTVKVHYTGTLIDGTKFDSSVDRGEPAEFPVGGVIPGWTEALQLMKPGAKFKLAIPSELAYGPQGRPSIPANSVLLFDVELIEVAAAKKPTAKK
jgi:FKBP-type peptidyl-prolyl cis-trans isomerase FkpA/FKBP-type peptidyl-prolyl cis-trans isomerase FklB